MCQALPPHLSLCSVWLCLGFFFMFSFFPLNFFEVELMVHLPGNQKMQGMSRLPEAKSKHKQSPAAWFCPLLELE